MTDEQTAAKSAFLTRHWQRRKQARARKADLLRPAISRDDELAAINRHMETKGAELIPTPGKADSVTIVLPGNTSPMPGWRS